MKRTKPFFIALLVLNLVTSVYSAYSQIWIWGDSCRIDFVNGTATVGKANCSGETSSILQLPNGLIYASACEKDLIANGLYAGRVYNTTGGYISWWPYLYGDGRSNNLILIPYPDDSSKAFVFQKAWSQLPPIYSLKYSVVDIYGNGGTGVMLQQNVPLLQAYLSDAMHALRHGNGRDWWVYVRECALDSSTASNLWFRYLVDPNGIHGPFTQNIGQLSYFNFDELNFDPSGSKAVYLTQDGIFDLYDVDRCTGEFYNFQQIHQRFPYYFFNPPYPPKDEWSRTGAYSPNGRYFYSTAGFNGIADTAYLMQFDMQAANIWASRQVIYRFPPQVQGIDYYPWELRRAPDNKIYLTGYGYAYPYADTCYHITNQYLSVINSPDSAGLACNFTPFSFYLGGNRTYSCLPDMPDYSIGVATGSGCDTLLATGQSWPEETMSLLQCWPNPFYNELNIRWGGMHPLKYIKVLNADAREVVVMDAPPGEIITIPLRELSAGIYFIEAAGTTGKTYYKKMIKVE